MPLWNVLVSASLLGAIPTAYLVARGIARVDIRQCGDGNMGTKNTLDTLGSPAAILIGVVDIGKGAMALLVARQAELPEGQVLLAGAAVVGHDFSIFLRFRGARGSLSRSA
ncbi:MAG: glycerol-3-phosphate acyltransferase [Truepera sp.]|nr:glycerol-3-phosphate acyltransferase [Truepera sp.]